MLPPHLPFKVTVHTINWGKIELDAVLADFGKSGEYLDDPEKCPFGRFQRCVGLIRRPVNANRAILKNLTGVRFAGHCLFIKSVNERSSWFPGKSPTETELNEYVVYELAYPAWKQINAAFSRAKKLCGYRDITVTPLTQRFLQKYIQMHRTKRGIDREVSNVSGIKVST